MAMVVGNPEELIAFLNVLQRYLDNIDTETNQLLSAFNSLESTWRDQQAAKFDEELKELVNRLNIFKENAEEKIPHLRKLAYDLENYLRR